MSDESKRIFCVDLLRGLDIFFLLAISYILLWQGVFNVWPLESTRAKVIWDHALTAFAAPGSVPTGFGIQDFTQPLFIFVTGVSASLAFRKFVRADGVSLSGFGHFTFRNFDVTAKESIVIRGNAKSPVRDVRLESFRGTIETAEPIDVKAVEGQVIDRFDVSSGNVGKPQGTCDFK